MAQQQVIIHAADLHLGAPLESLGRHVDETKAAHLRGLATGAFGRLIDLTIERQAAALVLAGDIYDDADREVAAQLRVKRGFERLHEAGIPVFMVHGNHDPLTKSYRPAATLPPNVHVFASGEVSVRELPSATAGDWHVAGISFSKAAETGNLAERFRGLGAQGADRLVRLAVSVIGEVVAADGLADDRGLAVVHVLRAPSLDRAAGAGDQFVGLVRGFEGLGLLVDGEQAMAFEAERFLGVLLDLFPHIDRHAAELDERHRAGHELRLA